MIRRRTIGDMVGHVTSSSARLLDELPSWVTLFRAPNPGPMTLDGTNTWVLRAPGTDTSVVVDPGPLHEAHLDAVARHASGSVATLSQEGLRPSGLVILATHHHPDHVEGLPRFQELAPDAAPPTAPPAEVTTVVAAGPLVIRAHPTPGHTSDSVCFVAECGGESVVLTGDTILGRGTTVVAHPDGDLGQYLHSLRALTGLGAIPVLPGHGPALADCGAAARFYLEHRMARLDQIRTARQRGAASAEEIVRHVYADVDRTLWPAAEWSVRAQLAYLAQTEETAEPAARMELP